MNFQKFRLGKKIPKEKRLMILVDYKNISDARGVADEGLMLDFQRLRDQCLEIGVIDEAFVFVPNHWASDLPSEINNLGFEIVACQGVKTESKKIEDTVDIHIIRRAWKALNNNPYLTDVVLVGHDGHMNEWVKEAKMRRKKIHIFATEKMSYLLKQSYDFSFPLPLKYK